MRPDQIKPVLQGLGRECREMNDADRDEKDR